MPIDNQKTEQLKLVESGPECIVLELLCRLSESKWKQRIRVYRHSRRIDFENEVEWKERNVLAKVFFDFNILTRIALTDNGAGFTLRETHQNTSWQEARYEVCQHMWSDLSESDYGIAILNDSKYGVSFERNKVGLSLLRGSCRPDPYADEGCHTFTYSIYPHKGSMQDSDVVEQAWFLNTPPLLSDITPCGFALDQDNIHVQALKQADYRDDALVIRLTEMKGMRNKAILKIPLLIKGVNETNMLEDILQDQSRFSFEAGQINFDMAPFEIRTFILNL